MLSSKHSVFDYQPDRIYTFEEFEAVNDWLKTHELVIDNVPISHFELDSEGKLIPMPQTPIKKEAAVGEIVGQLRNWNINTRQNGGVTTSQGGFNLSTTGGRTIRAPDVAFTPKQTYCNLTQQQLLTFRGQPFSPIFAVEVEDLSVASKLSELTRKFKDEYFPAGVELGWLIDPRGKDIYVFKKNRTGTVHRRHHGWNDVGGGGVLPGFVLKVWRIEEAISQVCYIILLYYFHRVNSNYILWTGCRNRRNPRLRTMAGVLAVLNAIKFSKKIMIF